MVPTITVGLLDIGCLMIRRGVANAGNGGAAVATSVLTAASRSTVVRTTTAAAKEMGGGIRGSLLLSTNNNHNGVQRGLLHQRWLQTSARLAASGSGRGSAALPSGPTWSVKSLINNNGAAGTADGDTMSAAQVSREDVVRLGKLSHLPVDDADVETLRDGLNQLLDFTRQVQAVDTAGVEPLHTVLDVPLPLRPDIAEEPVADILKNAPQEFERFFVAPLEKHFDGTDEGGVGGGGEGK